jgi:hypothetical protein
VKLSFPLHLPMINYNNTQKRTGSKMIKKTLKRAGLFGAIKCLCVFLSPNKNARNVRNNIFNVPLQQDPWLRIGWWQRWQGRGFLNVLQRNAWLGPCVTVSSCLSSRCIGGLIVGAFFFSCWHKHDLIHGIFPNLTKLAPYPRSFRLVKLVTSSTKPRQAT